MAKKKRGGDSSRRCSGNQSARKTERVFQSDEQLRSRPDCETRGFYSTYSYCAADSVCALFHAGSAFSYFR